MVHFILVFPIILQDTGNHCNRWNISVKWVKVTPPAKSSQITDDSENCDFVDLKRLDQ